MRYMITFTLAMEHQAEIAALIPGDQAHAKVLQEKGILEEVYVSMALIRYERGGHCWVVMKGESQAAIEKEMEGFPLYPYMRFEEIAALV